MSWSNYKHNAVDESNTIFVDYNEFRFIDCESNPIQNLKNKQDQSRKPNQVFRSDRVMNRILRRQRLVEILRS